MPGHLLEAVVDALDIVGGHTRAGLIVGADSAAVLCVLADEQLLIVADVGKPEQVSFGGVDCERRSDRGLCNLLVVGEEGVKDLPTCLPDTDSSNLHLRELCGHYT